MPTARRGHAESPVPAPRHGTNMATQSSGRGTPACDTRLISIQCLGLRRTADFSVYCLLQMMHRQSAAHPPFPGIFNAIAEFTGHSAISARSLLSSHGIMGNSHDQSRCQVSTSCVPGIGSLSCLSAGSPLRPHSSLRARASCCGSGSRACRLANGNASLGRRWKAADSPTRSHAYIHTLLVLPIGCFESWKGMSLAVRCR
jgi:hypothetical protein